MSAIAVALISLVGTVIAAVLPKWLDKRGFPHAPTAQTVSLGPPLVLGAFSLVGVLSACNADRTIAASFFLGIAGISSAMFGSSAASHSVRFGVYTGYVSAIIAMLFLVYSLLVGSPDSSYFLMYAWAHSLALIWSERLLWRSFFRRLKHAQDD
jgi:hypothetical protein